MMNLESLGLRSDLSLIDGEFISREGYLVVRSPGQPGYYWGNLLVFENPPSEGCLEEWESIFDSEFADIPEVRHRTFTWDLADDESVVGDFVTRKYHHEKTVVLVAREIRQPPHPNRDIEIRVLETNAEWDEVAALQVASRDPEHSEDQYRAFIDTRLAGLRAKTRAGIGEWYGAYLGGRQVATLGLFRNDSIGRFQEVVTDPDFRRQGICGTLVYEVSRRTLERDGIDSLVMLADTEYHAARIYESVGFCPEETLEGLCQWPNASG